MSVGYVGDHIHKNGFDLGFSEVALPRVGVLLVSQGSEGCCSFIVFDDIAWGNDVFESITLSDLSTLLAVTSNDENGVVFFDHLSHRSVTANKLRRGNFNVELSG